MRILCGGCDKNPASVMCCADEVALCTECDARAHAANKHANKRARVALRPAPEPTKCDICQVGLVSSIPRTCAFLGCDATES